MIIPAYQYLSLREAEKRFVEKSLTPYGELNDYYNFDFDFEKLSKDFEKKFDLKLVLDENRSVSTLEHETLISNKQVPFSKKYDHDLIIHVLPMLQSDINYKEIFKELQKIENVSFRALLTEH